MMHWKVSRYLVSDEGKVVMVKYKKRELLEWIAVLQNTSSTIKEISTMERDVLIDTLTQCQQIAIEIGSFIETKGNIGEKIVGLLEEYCETIYQQSINLHNETEYKHLHHKIQNQLKKIDNKIRYELPEDKKEIVFFPYHASMWDSLESIWEAANEDESCEVYVVPIPYYEKKPGGSFGEMHYERDGYPNHVPIIPWQEYHVAERKPDMIFIHNPYDNWNHVTSIHPSFYSSELRKHTKMLVYIPYFILPEIEPSHQSEIDNMKHLCFSPGVIYANKVIVQSEKIRQIYITEYLKEAESNKLYFDRRQVEDKILGLGSPKLDKVQNYNSGEHNIPEQWMSILRKKDGTLKKAIFYNTTIVSLLKNREKMIQKMENIFSIFREQKDEVALLWRPHPLLEATVKSMRPQLWISYKQLVEQYKNEGWGIYDDTADLNRTIGLSDGYYGDRSSVIQLYQKTGKPIMIQDVDILESQPINEEEQFPVWMMDFCMVENEMWFVHGKVNVLMKYNLKTNKTTIIGSIPNEKNLQYGLYYSIHFYKGSIILVPCSAKEIAVYNIKTNRFTKINIKNSEACRCGIFRKSYIDDNFIYCIPSSYHEFIRINLDNWTIEYLGNWRQLLPKDINKEAYISDVTQMGQGKYAGLVYGTNIIIIYNALRKELSMLTIDYENHNYIGIAGSEEYLSLQDMNSKKIISYSLNDEKVVSTFSNLNSMPYQSNYFEKGYLVLDAINNRNLMVFDGEGNICYEEQAEQDFKKNQYGSDYYFGIFKYSEGLLYFNNLNKTLYRFDGNCMTKISEILIGKEDLKNIKEIVGKAKEQVMTEAHLYYVKDWINDLSNYSSKLCHIEGRVGKSIFKELRKIDG